MSEILVEGCFAVVGSGHFMGTWGILINLLENANDATIRTRPGAEINVPLGLLNKVSEPSQRIGEDVFIKDDVVGEDYRLAWGRICDYDRGLYSVRFETGDGIFYRAFTSDEIDWELSARAKEEKKDRQNERDRETKIVSDGGSSSYYEIHVPKSLVREDGDNYIFQVEHVIEYGLNNDFDKGNLFKVLYRLGRKAGNTLRYEIKKMYYSLKKLEDRFEREGKLDE